MKSIRFTLVLFLLSTLLFPQRTFLATEETFNPNFLISDEELQDWSSMGRPDIQAFLEERGSFLATHRTEDKDGISRLASDIIYRSAIDNKINPKYLLVKLQKEQSLITTQTPSQKQLDGATGYGITDGCGWTCETYFNNRGFGKQVDSAAGIMRWYYENVSTQSWIKRPPLGYQIDGQYITPTSLATAFLYTYTPHIEGNKNFWTLWQSWFDQVYPDGTILKTINGADVYIIQEGKKRKFASMSALVTRYDPKHIILVPASELSRYDLGADISLPNYSIVRAGSTYYLLDYNTKRPFANSEMVGTLGYNPDEILDVTEEVLHAYNTGAILTSETANPLGEIIRLKENNALYYLQDNQYFPIYDDAILNINFSHLSVETATIEKLKGFVQGPPVRIKDGTLILVEGDNKVYVIEKGKKRHIASEEVFIGLGYSWNNIVTVNEFTGIAHETGQPVYLRAGVTAVADLPSSTQNTPENENTDITSPDDIQTKDVMVRTPSSSLAFIGAQFETPVDSYIVTDVNTGDVLSGKNVDTVRPMASLAKVMTAYTLLKEGLHLDDDTTYNDGAHGIHDPAFVQYRIKTGERVRNEHIFEAMLISSINAAARMLVSSVATESTFIKNMNVQLASWGLTNTSLVDVYGGGVQNDTTAREYATIFSKTTADETLREYLGKTSYEYDELFDLDGYPHHFDKHSNHLTTETGLPFTILASKTGYIEEAGDNLAMLVERKTDKKQFVIITLGNPNHTNKFEEPKAISIWAMGL